MNAEERSAVQLQMMLDKRFAEHTERLIGIVQQGMTTVQQEANTTRSAFLKAIAEISQKTERSPTDFGQANVLNDGGGTGSLFAIRYRNDTATGDAADIHRLEWIAKSSAYDAAKLTDAGKTEADMTGDYASDHDYMWDDDLWNKVVGGEAVAV